MMRHFPLLIALAVMLVFPGTTAAKNLIELRLGGFINSSTPSDLEQQIESIDSSTFSGFNVDVYLKIPATSFGAGLRYESSSQELEGDAGGDGVELDVNDMALILGWRLLDSQLFHVGPLVTVGVPWGDVKVNASGEVDTSNVDADQLSFGIGVEGGVFFGRFLLGAEVGYKSLQLEKPGLFELVPSIDMSGFYGRLQVGVGLF